MSVARVDSWLRKWNPLLLTLIGVREAVKFNNTGSTAALVFTILCLGALALEWWTRRHP